MALQSTSASGKEGPRLRFTNLIVPVLITLVPFFLMEIWGDLNNFQVRENDRAAWRSEMKNRLADFSSSFSLFRQIRLLNDRLQDALTLGPPLRTGDRSNFSQKLVSAFTGTFPASHRPPGTRLYGFSLVKQEPVLLLENGLERNKGRFLANLIKDFLAYPHLNESRRAEVQRRVEKTFGQLASADVLAIHRKGFPIRVVFEGKPIYFLWDTINRGKAVLGGYFALFPPELAGAARPLEFALSRSIGSGNPPGGLNAMLLPMEMLRERLTPVFAPEKTDLVPARRLLDQIAGRPYDYVASAGLIAEPVPGLWVFRSPVHFNLPYELWFWRNYHPPPVRVSLTIARTLALCLAFLWTLLLGSVTFFSYSPRYSLRFLFFFYLVLIGITPLSFIFLSGMMYLETGTDRRITDTVSRTLQLFRNLDSRSSEVETRFSRACQEFWQDNAFKHTILSGEISSDHPLIEHCFKVFDRKNLPLDSLFFLHAEKSPQVFVASGSPNSSQRGSLDFFGPMVVNSAVNFHPEASQRLRDRLPPRGKTVARILTQIMSEAAFNDLAHYRQGSQFITFEGKQYLHCYDYLHENRLMKAFLTFRGDGFRIFQRFLMEKFPEIGRKTGAPLMLGWTKDGRFRYRPSKSPKLQGKRALRLQRLMKQALATRSFRTIRGPNEILVAFPLKRMNDLVIGTVISLETIQQGAASGLRLLKGVTFLFFLLVIFVGTLAAGYFLVPLGRIRDGLSRVVQGNLGRELRLDRDDELGAVTSSFNEMLEGLRRRRHLGRFVSGTLNKSLADGNNEDSGIDRSRGVVLASDIRGFTTHCEQHPPEEIVAMLNNHLERMAAAIQQHGGTIEKFIGDAIVAWFPGPSPAESGRSALRAATEMMSQHRLHQTERATERLFTFEIGIGLSWGTVTSGRFGDRGRREFAILGNPREEAEELEALSKLGTATRIIICRELAGHLDAGALLPLGDTGHFELKEGAAG